MPSTTVKTLSGVPEAEQRSNFQNATLQGAGPHIAVSIATSVTVPPEVYGLGEAAVEGYLRALLGKATIETDEALSFEVQIGPAE